MKTVITLIAIMMVSIASVSAQQTAGIIKGKVTTTDNKPAAMVTVVLKNTKRNALSGDDGSFVIRNVQPGNYELEVSLIGYETTSQQVSVQANKTTDLSFRLQVSDQQLQEVIVKSGLKSYKSNLASSSLRVQTPILEMPQNIQIVTGKTLADQQVISMSDGLIRNVSGAVRLEHWGDMYTNISSRGSQIQAFRNGFNFVNSYWGPLTEDMSFVDHVEFVKGPAGFMLASGEPSGLYNVVTKKPTGQTKREVSFSIGSFDLYRTALDLDGKLSKDGRLLYRLNLAAQNKKSHRANEYNNRYAIAPVISYQLDEKTKLTAEYTYQKAKMSDVGSYYIFSADGFATLPVDFTMLPAGLPATNIDDHSFFVNLQHQLAANWKITGQLAYNRYRQLGSSMWPSAVNPDGTVQRAVGSWDAKSNMTMAQVFVNGDVTTGLVHHRLLGGIDMSNKEYFADWGQNHVLDSAGALFDTKNPYYGVPVNGYPRFDYSTPLEERATAIGGTLDQRYTALYVQDELGFLDNKIRLTLAGRYTYLSQAEWGGAPVSDKHFTPRVGLSISVDKHTSVYAVYDQAFIPQAGKLANGGDVKPITGSNSEIGIKRDWAGGKWNTTLAVYSIEKNNELVADPNSPPTAGLSIVLGKKRSEGFEFDLRGKITNELSLIANYALTESKVAKVADGVTDMKEGDIVPGYAKHIANAWLNYKMQSGKLKGLGVSAGFSFLAGRETWWDPSPDPSQVLPDYFKLDGGLSWERDKINVTLNVFNILNKYLYSGSYYQWLNAYNWQTDPPRNARLSIAYRF
jgi:iron complex outermembrane receptor protein